MAVPYDLYIRFLVTKNIDDLVGVNTCLADLNLPPIKQSVFEAQYDLVVSTVPPGVLSQIENASYSVDFMKWMRALEVADLWYFEKAFLDQDQRPKIKLTYDIHQDIQVRTAVNALLIKGVPPPDVLNTIHARFSTLLKEDHIALYQRFFFNPSRMTRRDWKGWLHSLEGLEQSIYFKALTEPLDVVKNELELPARISVSDTLQFLLSKTYQKAKQYLQISTSEANREARAWISQTISLAEKYEKYRSGDTTDFGNALQLEFEFVEEEFPTPDKETLAALQAEIKAKELQKGQGGEEGVSSPEAGA